MLDSRFKKNASLFPKEKSCCLYPGVFEKQLSSILPRKDEDCMMYQPGLEVTMLKN
jgi:hypothetical protein